MCAVLGLELEGIMHLNNYYQLIYMLIPDQIFLSEKFSSSVECQD